MCNGKCSSSLASPIFNFDSRGGGLILIHFFLQKIILKRLSAAHLLVVGTKKLIDWYAYADVTSKSLVFSLGSIVWLPLSYADVIKNPIATK